MYTLTSRICAIAFFPPLLYRLAGLPKTLQGLSISDMVGTRTSKRCENCRKRKIKVWLHVLEKYIPIEQRSSSLFGVEITETRPI